MFEYSSVIMTILQFLAALFIFVIGVGVLVVIVMYIRDVSQTTHAIRRNYPVVGRFRYMFENMGEFFRQYFFAQDREEQELATHGIDAGLPGMMLWNNANHAYNEATMGYHDGGKSDFSHLAEGALARGW